jgi:hypothetical protein
VQDFCPRNQQYADPVAFAAALGYPTSMSAEDIERAKQKALSDYEECKSRLAGLEAAAGQTVRVLEKVCEFLRGDYDRFASGGLEEVLSAKTISLMADLHKTRNRVEVLRETARRTHPHLDL